MTPYAQALKHIAIRGRKGLDSSAVEDEVAMYRAGTLPLDYKPPPDSAWDDTIERWAYAWQFPLPDNEQVSDNKAMSVEPAMDAIEAFADRLLAAPPSALPRSAEHSAQWQLIDTSARAAAALPDTTAAGASRPVLSAPTVHGLSADPAMTEDDQAQVDDVVANLFGVDALEASIVGAAPADAAAVPANTNAGVAIIPAAEYSKKHGGIPIAYLDDRSERAQASKELGLLLTDELGLAYDGDGMTAVISALSHRGNLVAGKALLDFALQLGFDATPDLFGALMHGHAKKGDFNAVILLTEDMKERGVTPAPRNWHHLMAALTNAGQCTGAVQVADNMRSLANLEPDELTFIHHLRALARDRSRPSAPFEAVALFDQMENTYGISPTRRHYHELLSALANSLHSDHQQRLVDVARKMELIGIPWDTYTYHLLIKGAHGDLSRVEELCGRMREEGLELEQPHFAAVLEAHLRSMTPGLAVDYGAMKERGESPLDLWLDRITTSMGIFELAKRRAAKSGAPIAPRVMDALFGVVCEAVALSVDVLPEDEASARAMVKLEAQAAGLWQHAFTEHGVPRTRVSHEHYLRMLGALQRIDEAETLFMALVEQQDETPTYRTYEAMILMHLASGEEGSTARALRYMEAMEAVGYPVRKRTLHEMVKVADQASYKRDMKRRARRIMQAREEYIRRREAEAAAAAEMASRGAAAAPGVGSSLATFGGYEAPEDEGWKKSRDASAGPAKAIVPKDDATTTTAPATLFAWWDRWRATSVNKHELFDSEREDGLPRGESFAEKNAALAKMGITSLLPTKADLPQTSRQSLVNTIRKEEGSEPAGALWTLDGTGSVYPNTATGPGAWGATFWRERQIVRKEIEAVRAGHGTLPPFSAAGNAVRTTAEQIAIETSNATTAGELRDAVELSEHKYDDGAAKPVSEFAVAVSPTSSLVWHAEKRDPLAPYRSDEDVAQLAGDDEAIAALRREAASKSAAAIEAIRNKQEAVATVVGRGITNKKKYDYLEHFRQLYRQGSLEAPDEPLVRFGRSETDLKSAMAAQVRGWFDAQRRKPPTDTAAAKAAADLRADREAAVARSASSKQRDVAARRSGHRQQRQRDRRAGQGWRPDGGSSGDGDDAAH